MSTPFNGGLFKMGYFIVYWHPRKGWFGNQIVRMQLKKGFDKESAQYTHVEVSGGGIHSVNIAPPRSELVEITKKHAGRHVCLMRLRDDYYERKGRYKVAYFSASLNNQHYDFPGVLSFLFKWIKQAKGLPFCSEGAAWAVKKVCPKTLDGLRPSKIMPAHFFHPKYFAKVWEGDIPK